MFVQNTPKSDNNQKRDTTPAKPLVRMPDWLEFVEGGLFDQATRWQRLWEAWERVRDNNGAAGGDGVTIARFAPGAEARLSRLSHELRAGRWRPSPYRRVLIPKESGGERPLDIPAVIDRVVHAAIGLTLSPVLDPEFADGSFAYRPGRSVPQAVARVGALRREGYRHVLDADIRRFFEQVVHERVITKLEAYVEDLALVDLIGVILEHHSHRGRGLPQGSPLSPLLANLALDAMDEALSGQGMRIVRFADDFLVLCKSDAGLKNAAEKAAALLQAEGLELNPEKTRLISFDQGFSFLGHKFLKGMIWKEVEADETPAEALLTDAPPEPFEEEPEEDEADNAPGRYAARQRVLYMLEPGRVLAAKGESFEVRDADGAVKLSLPHRRVDRIELGPETEASMAALDLAAATDTRLCRVDGFGRTLGQWSAAPGGRATLQLQQAALVADPARRLALARIIVAGRIASQWNMLKRLRLDKPRDEKIEAEMAVAKQRFDRAERAALLSPRITSISDVMGEEGAMGALYWPLIALNLGRPEIYGGLRRRRVGQDPLNAVLDVLSGFLARDISVALSRVGLHTGFGVLHSADDGAEAAVYDLMEEFRAPLVEAQALALFNRKALDSDDFTFWGDTCRLTRGGYAACIRGYEAALTSRAVTGQRSGEKMLWRGIMEEQAAALAAHCAGGPVYQPHLWR